MALGSGGSGAGSAGIKAGAAYVTLYVKNTLSKGLGQAHKDMKAFGDGVGRIGLGIAKSGAAIGVGLGAVFGASVKRSAEFGMLSLKFAESAENLSALSYAADTASLSHEELFAAMKKLPSTLVEAQDGASDLGQMFKALNLDAAALANGKPLDAVLAIADAMNASDLHDFGRLNFLQDAFGKGGQQMNEFLALGSKGIREMMQEAADVGAVVTGEQARQAKAIEDSFTKAWKATKNGILAVGDALLPHEQAVANVVAGITEASRVTREWIGANREVVLGVGLAAAGVTAVGVGMMVLGPAISAAAAGWSVFAGAIVVGKAAVAAAVAAIASPILLLPAGLAAAGAAWLAFTEQGRAAVGGLAGRVADAFGSTFQDVAAGWKGVVAAVGRGDFATAFAVGTATAKLEWVKFTNFLERTWLEWTTTFTVAWQASVAAFSAAMKKVGLLRDEDREAADLAAAGRVRHEGFRPQALDPKARRNEAAQAGGKAVAAGLVANFQPQADELKGLAGKMAADALAAGKKFEGEMAALKRDQKAKEDEAKLDQEAALLGGFLSTLREQIAGQLTFAAGGWGDVKGLLGGPAAAGLAAQMQATQTRGAFGGDAAAGMFGDGGVAQDIADNTKETAENVVKLMNRLGTVRNADGTLSFAGWK